MDDLYNLRPEREEDADQSLPRRRRREADEEAAESQPRSGRRPRKSSSSGRQMSTRVKILLWLAAIAAVIGAMGILGIWYTVRTIRRAPFRKHMNEYLAASPAVGMSGQRGVGKMVVVDAQDKDVDSLHFDLPDDLRAATPEEVVTVARLIWTKNTVGTYEGGGSAYQWTCDVTIVDLASQTVSQRQHLDGQPPPQTFHGRRGESRSGDKPTAAVLAFLKSLPRTAAPPPAVAKAPAGGNPAPANNRGPDSQPIPRVPFEIDPQLLGPQQKVNLSVMQEFEVVNGPWPFSKGVLGDPANTPIRLNRVKAPRGLSMRPGAGARACYALGGRARLFGASVGLADGPEISQGNVTFEVVGDGESLWRSRPVRNRGDVQTCEVNVVGVKVLELRTRVDGPDAGANAVWISVHVEK